MKSGTRLTAAAVIAAVLTVGTAAGASAASIDASGPIARIQISETLNCAVDLVGESEGEFFGDTACGTFIAVGGQLFGPEDTPAGPDHPDLTPWTPIAQNKSGAGTASDP